MDMGMVRTLPHMTFGLAEVCKGLFALRTVAKLAINGYILALNMEISPTMCPRLEVFSSSSHNLAQEVVGFRGKPHKLFEAWHRMHLVSTLVLMLLLQVLIINLT